MLPDSNTVAYLSKVSYLEEKCLVSVEFQNSEKKFSKAFKFFPRALLRVSAVTEPIVVQLLNSFDRKKFKVEKKNISTLEITARAFSDLKRFANFLSASVKMRLVLIEPERQFLLSQGWSYFDSFCFSNTGLEFNGFFSLPNVHQDWLHGFLGNEISVLLEESPETAERILNAVALSNILCVPVNLLPEQNSRLAELFLEAVSFRNFFVPEKEDSVFENNKFSFFSGNQQDFSQIDFSGVWHSLFGKAFFNLGFETIDCDCCVPETAFQDNVLPSSSVEVEFRKNGLFFESKLDCFAQRFHDCEPGKESRLQRQKEFCLQFLPVGPFSENDKVVVPVEDALRLEKDNSATIIDASKDLHWFCRQNESFLSQEFSALNKKIVFLSDALEKKRALALKQHGVFFENKLLLDPEAVFLKQSILSFSLFLETVPLHLLSVNSSFFCKELAIALLAVQSIILKDFRILGQSLGAKTAHFGNNKCVLPSRQALSVSREFAKKACLPLPCIK